MACEDFLGRTAFDKVLRHKAFNIANNPQYAGYYMLHVQINLLSKMKLYQTNSYQNKYTNQLLVNLKTQSILIL